MTPSKFSGIPGHITVPDHVISSLTSFFTAPALWPGTETQIEAFIQEKTQKPWNDLLTLERLRQAIQAQKGLYWKEGPGRTVTYHKGYQVLAYLAYHAPVYCIQAAGLLFMMARMGLFGPSVRLLDAGAGPGMVSLAAAEILPLVGVRSTVISSVEQEQEHIEAYSWLVKGKEPLVTVHRPFHSSLQDFEPGNSGPYDLIVFQNVLNELSPCPDGVSGLLATYTEALTPEGSLLLVEPAEQKSASALRMITAGLVKKGLSLHSPCPFLWGSRCEPLRCWSFVECPGIRETRLGQALSDVKDGYRYRNTDIKYAYAVIRKERTTSVPYRVERGSEAVRCSRLPACISRDVFVTVAVMSGNLGDESHTVRKVCDGTGGKPVFGVLPAHHRSGANRDFQRAGYGDVITLGPVRVRVNPARDAINLFITRNTVVKTVYRQIKPCLQVVTDQVSGDAPKRTHMFKSAGDIPTRSKRTDRKHGGHP